MTQTFRLLIAMKLLHLYLMAKQRICHCTHMHSLSTNIRAKNSQKALYPSLRDEMMTTWAPVTHKESARWILTLKSINADLKVNGASLYGWLVKNGFCRKMGKDSGTIFNGTVTNEWLTIENKTSRSSIYRLNWWRTVFAGTLLRLVSF